MRCASFTLDLDHGEAKKWVGENILVKDNPDGRKNELLATWLPIKGGGEMARVAFRRISRYFSLYAEVCSSSREAHMLDKSLA